MAGPTEISTTQNDDTAPLETVPLRDEIREAAARLYAQGYKRPQISRILLKHLYPKTEFEDGLKIPLEQRLTSARNKLKRWENQESFRNLVWAQGVAKLDLQTPAILSGIAKKAKAGRVDAARLALEVTGRHNPKGEMQPAQIVVQFEGVPRPARIQAADQQVTLEGEIIEEVDE